MTLGVSIGQAEESCRLPFRGRISVVIPAYNCAGTIRPAVDSVLSQGVEDLELIVVNDGSTDGTAGVLSGFGPRVRVVEKPNGGLASARNAGQQAASGEFLAWMDADDLMLPGRLRAQAEVLCRHPEIGLVSSDFGAFRGDGEVVAASYVDAYYHALDRFGGIARAYPDQLGLVEVSGAAAAVRAGQVYDHLVWGNFVHPPTVMARRALMVSAGLADENLRYSSDYEFLIRLARLTRFAFVDVPLLQYRLSPGQMSHTAGAHLMQVETARILERLHQADASLAERAGPTLRRRIAESLIHAADAIAARDRVKALGLLIESLRHQALVGASAVVVGRMVIPPSVIPLLKHLARSIIRVVALAASLGPPDAWEAGPGILLT